MSSEEETLAHLLLDLPDPDQDLSVQVIGPALTEFQYFKELPAELRICIWKLCFPGTQQVSIDNFRPLNNKRPLPVTLFVNQESRRETGRVYSLFHLLYRSPKSYLNLTLCFSSTRDIIHISSGMLFFSHQIFRMQLAVAQEPLVFARVKRLELDGLVNHVYDKRKLHERKSDDKEDFLFPCRWMDSLWEDYDDRGIFQFFTGSPEIIIQPGTKVPQNLSQDLVDGLKKQINTIFKKLKDEDRFYKLPDVE